MEFLFRFFKFFSLSDQKWWPDLAGQRIIAWISQLFAPNNPILAGIKIWEGKNLMAIISDCGTSVWAYGKAWQVSGGPGVETNSNFGICYQPLKHTVFLFTAQQNFGLDLVFVFHAVQHFGICDHTTSNRLECTCRAKKQNFLKD